VLVGFLILRQLENLSFENIVLEWKRNPYYQVFCGLKAYQNAVPCHATELVHFRKRIGQFGVEKIPAMSVSLHGQAVEEKTVNVDTTVQEKISPIQPMASSPLRLLIGSINWPKTAYSTATDVRQRSQRHAA
jgi:hypothetical protein